MDGGAWQAAVHGVAKSRTRLSDFTFTHWRRKWQPTPVFLPGESQGWRSLVGCRLWGRTESDTTEATLQQHPHLTERDPEALSKEGFSLPKADSTGGGPGHPASISWLRLQDPVPHHHQCLGHCDLNLPHGNPRRRCQGCEDCPLLAQPQTKELGSFPAKLKAATFRLV